MYGGDGGEFGRASFLRSWRVGAASRIGEFEGGRDREDVLS